MAKTLAQIRTGARSVIRQTDSSNSNFTDSDLTGFANEAYRRIAIALRSIPKKDHDYTVSGATVALNSATINVQEALIKDPTAGNKYKRLRVILLEQLIALDPDYPNADSGVPEVLARTDTSEAVLYPPPSAAVIALTTPLRTWGLEMPTALSSDSDTPNLPENLHDIMENWVAFKCFESLGDSERATQQLTIFRGALKEMKEISTSFSNQVKGWRLDDDGGGSDLANLRIG